MGSRNAAQRPQAKASKASESASIDQLMLILGVIGQGIFPSFLNGPFRREQMFLPCSHRRRSLDAVS